MQTLDVGLSSMTPREIPRLKALDALRACSNVLNILSVPCHGFWYPTRSKHTPAGEYLNPRHRHRYDTVPTINTFYLTVQLWVGLDQHVYNPTSHNQSNTSPVTASFLSTINQWAASSYVIIFAAGYNLRVSRITTFELVPSLAPRRKRTGVPFL